MSKFEISFPEREVRLVMTGKTGAGKSSAANTILGEDLCDVARGMSSGTEECVMRRAKRHGIHIKVTDTPGVCDTHRSLEEIHREICKSVATVVPGPHAILMCFRCDQRFTDEEYQAYVQLKKLFGEHMKKHMIVIFNGLDEAKPPNIDELGKNIKQLGFVLGDLKSPDRHVLLNNEARGRRRDEQADQVLDVVTQVFLDNDRRYFTDDIMEEFEKQMMKKEREGMTREMVQEAVLKNDKNVAKAFENALTEEEVRKRGRCAIL